MKSLDKLYEKLEKPLIYFILFAFLLSEFISIAVPKYSEFIDGKGSLIMIALVLLAMFRYVDRNMVHQKKEEINPIIRFTTDISILLKDKKYNEVKIFAVHGGMYLRAIIESGIKIKKLTILLRDVDHHETIVFPRKASDKKLLQQDSLRFQHMWRDLVKNKTIEEIDIKYYPFDSILHFMIIENKILHFGLLRPSPDYPGSSVLPSYLVRSETKNGSLLIENFLEEFNSINDNFTTRKS